jgi:hypothetical protein
MRVNQKVYTIYGYVTVVEKRYSPLSNKVVWIGLDSTGSEHEIDDSMIRPEPQNATQSDSVDLMAIGKAFNLKKGDKGDTGATGPRGYTPKSGVDYYSKDQMESMVRSICNDFKTKTKVDVESYLKAATPIKGKDYFDGKDGKTPKYGKDYFTEDDIRRFVKLVIKEVKPILPKGEKGDAPEHKWEGTKLSFKKPDGKWGESVDLVGLTGLPGNGGGGIHKIDDATDVSISSPTNGQALKYNSTTKKWENGTVSGGGSGTVETIVAGNNIDIDATDPANPIVSVETLTLADISDVTASATELNVLDGIPATLTATEIGYLDGVTSAIQTQLDAKLDDSQATAFGLSLLDDANAAAGIATLGLDADIATLSLPASTTISAFGATLVDDAAASNARTTLGLGTVATLASDTDGTLAANSDSNVATQKAVKTYVDAVAQGLSVKTSCILATAAALPANTYLAGVITITATGTLTVDGTVTALNDRILVKDEVAALGNGVYKVTTAGAVGVAAVLTRSTDMDIAAEFPGAFVFIETGTVNAAAGFVCTNSTPPTVGTTAINFTQFSGAGEITAGAALTKTANTLDVAVDGTGIEVNADALRLKDAGVTLAKMANLAQDQFIGRTTASTGVPETATITAAARTVLDDTTVGAMVDTLGGGSATGTGVLVRTNTPTLTTPVFTGLPTGSGVASAATASTLVSRDANANVLAANFIEGFRTQATAAGTTTLVVGDTYTQVFTGSSTQTCKLPTTSIVAGQQYLIINQSSGAVTVQSSGSNTITILAANTSAVFTAVVATPTTAANWSSLYLADIVASGKSLTVSNTLTLAGTDATTMTFPSTSATIARTDAANTFTGVQTMTSPALTTPVLGTPSSGTLTNCTGLPAAAIVPGTLAAGTYLLAENASIGLDPAGSADGKYSGITITGVGGATIAFGRLVYLKAADSRWWETDADATATGGAVMVGMTVTSTTAGAAVTILLMGQIRADASFPALTIGAPVYVGETAGDIQVAIPTGADNVIRVVGFALTADEIYFNPSSDHQITVS